MMTLSKFSNFPDELSENDGSKEDELSGSDCNYRNQIHDILLSTM